MQIQSSGVNQTPSNSPQVWKVFAGIAVLILDVALFRIAVHVSLLLLGPIGSTSSFWNLSISSFWNLPVFSLSILGVLLGRFFLNRGIALKLLYVLVCGIIPSWVALKGWEAIEEGRGKRIYGKM